VLYVLIGYNRWTKTDGFAQIEGLLEIGDLVRILKDIMVLKEELSSIAETIAKDGRRNTLSHNRIAFNISTPMITFEKMCYSRAWPSIPEKLATLRIFPEPE
jgi:hypothetical protein